MVGELSEATSGPPAVIFDICREWRGSEDWKMSNIQNKKGSEELLPVSFTLLPPPVILEQINIKQTTHIFHLSEKEI